MLLPTVSTDLRGWLTQLAFPFAQKAVSGAGDGAWLQTHATYTPDGKTGHTLIQTPNHRSWDFGRAPRSQTSHGALYVATHKDAFFEGWNTIADALHARYRVGQAGMLLDTVDGAPLVEVWGNVGGSSFVTLPLWNGMGIVASLQDMLDGFAALAVAPTGS